MLWSLRNKLVLTYLSDRSRACGPVRHTAGISAYIAAGQFEIHLADTRFPAERSQMSAENEHLADASAPLLERQMSEARRKKKSLPCWESERLGNLDLPRMRLHRETQSFLNGAPVPLDSGMSAASGARAKTPLGCPRGRRSCPAESSPDWFSTEKGLYLVVISEQRTG